MTRRFFGHKRPGMCPTCGEPKNGRSRCPNCLRENTRKINERNRERIKKHLCLMCGGENPTKFRSCDKCRKKYVAGVMRRRKERAELGLCIQCRKPKGEKFKRCKECREKARNRFSSG